MDNTVSASANQNKKKNSMTIDLFQVLKKVFQYWWIWILTTFVGGCGTFLFANANTQVTYTASTMLYVNNSSSLTSAIKDITSLSAADLSAANSAVDLYCIMIKTRNCLNRVDDQIRDRDGEVELKYESLFYDNSGTKLNLDDVVESWHPGYKAGTWCYTYSYINSNLTVSQVDSTEIFNVTFVSPYYMESMLISNAVSDVASYYIPNIINGTSVKTVDPAIVASAIGRGRVKTTLIGAIAGLVVGACIVLALYFLQDEIDNQNWFEEVYGELPVLATIPDTTEDSGKYGYKYTSKRYGYGYGVTKGYYGAKISDETNQNKIETKGDK